MSGDYSPPLGEFQPPDSFVYDQEVVTALESVAVSLRERMAREFKETVDLMRNGLAQGMGPRMAEACLPTEAELVLTSLPTRLSTVFPDAPTQSTYAPVQISTQAEVAATLTHGVWAWPTTPLAGSATEAQILEDLEMVLRERSLQSHHASTQTHCAPTVLLGQDEHERAKIWGCMMANLPSADPPTDHGCRLANYLKRQEARRGQTSANMRKTKWDDQS